MPTPPADRTASRIGPSEPRSAAADVAEPPSPYATGLRFAWLGRVSTEDQQDPTLSLPRQLHNARIALPPGAVIVAHFYDVESGRKDLDARGYSRAHERFAIPIPRDGGIQDLLAESTSGSRRFDAVICESIERVARRTYYGTKIEHDLEAAGVALFAADEPIVTSGKRATTILTRRVKQGVAEWYVLETLEKSWDGFCEHTRQGWNVGAPPYGYAGEKIPHPVPARRAEGKTKTRLMPDPIRGPVVTQIFTWRVVNHLGYQAIADRLNADLDRYPAPVSPDPARTRSDWTRSSVRDLLHNPKYTGYMVWNRRATKKQGKVNPPSAWVWSPQPTHEPLVTRELFDAASGVAAGRRGSRNGAAANKHPDTKRSYLLRSYVICDMCGRRMFGKTRRDTAYYACQPGLNLGRVARERYPDHPASIWIREDALIAGLDRFLADRVFGPHRRQLLAGDLGEDQAQQQRDKAARRAALQRNIDQLVDKQDRLVRTLESHDDPDGALFARIRDRLGDLEAERQAKLGALEQLQAEKSVQDVELIDQLPLGEFTLAGLPTAPVRALLDTLQLEVRYDRATNHATGRVTLDGDTAKALQQADDALDLTSADRADATDDCSHVERAPGGTRTSPPQIRTPEVTRPTGVISEPAQLTVCQPKPGASGTGSNRLKAPGRDGERVPRSRGSLIGLMSCYSS